MKIDINGFCKGCKGLTYSIGLHQEQVSCIVGCKLNYKVNINKIRNHIVIDIDKIACTFRVNYENNSVI